MALNIKNKTVEHLVEEVTEMTGETKVEAVRKALEERKDRLAFRVARQDRREALWRFLEREVWPAIPPEELGRRLSREEEDALLGYGPAGV